jgi:hypothetical protein
MKNLLYIAAIAATAVGLTSCSSNEDLNDAVKDSGVPFKVTASAPTRATDLNGTNFTNFQLYAFEGSSETPWINNVRFAKDASWTPASGTYTWPTKGATSTFYAVSENTLDGSFSGSLGNGDKTFTYSIPTDIASQKDLLAAYKTASSNDASVNLQFKHALAAAKLTLSIDPSLTVINSDYATYRLYAKIKSITFNNVNISGTYDIANDAWSNIGTGSYTITPSSPIVIDTKSTSTGSTAVDLGTNASIMFIPGTINYWNIKPNAAADVSTTPSNSAFVTFQAQAMVYDAEGIVTFLNKACATNNSGSYWAYKDASYFYSDAAKTNKIATSDGQLLDLTNAVFEKTNVNNILGADPIFDLQWKTVGDESAEFYPAETVKAGYGTLYKPLCKASYSVIGGNITTTYTNLTLSNTINHNFNIEIAGAINKAGADGTFGSPAQAGN